MTRIASPSDTAFDTYRLCCQIFSLEISIGTLPLLQGMQIIFIITTRHHGMGSRCCAKPRMPFAINNFS